MADSVVIRPATEADTGGGSRDCEGEAEVSVPAQTGSHGIEETNPELLKNTPSNIRRLVDEIQQCEGRQKYLAQTRSPSDGGDVRWYFCKVSLGVNELAASVPHTEVVGKGEYFRFGMRDSLAIEASFLQREEELLSSWWKEFADCSEGPRGRPSTSLKLTTQVEVSSLETVGSAQYAFEEERVGVPVKGGLYEVDLVKRHCFPVYWSGENRRVLRGHWFARKGSLDWLPLREDVGEQLEFAYRSKVWRRRTFQPSGLFAARVDLQGPSPGLHVLFTGEDDTWEAWLNVNASGFSSVISLRGHGIMLRRGYAASQASKPTQDELRQQKEEEMDDYCSQVPVRHLVFMVHGIGQRLEKSNLVDDVTNFRHITASLAERHLTTYQRSNNRVLFIPCQWRRGLKLSGESAVERITLDGVRGLRVMLSATVHDVLYYMSPIYCQDIIHSVSNQLNKLYLKFLKRNPGYDGKVSLYGHSLGSVLSYDILCHQEKLSSPFPMNWIYKENSADEECNSMSSQDKNASGVEENKDVATSKEMDNQKTKPVLEPECAEDPSGSAGFTVTSDVEEPFARSTNLDEQDDVLSLQKDGEKEVADSGGSVSCEKDDSSDAGEVYDGAQESDKDETIKLLRKELDSLRARVGELESQCYNNQENCREPAPVTSRSDVGERPCEKDEEPKRYTPYIHYTKLEFKVDTFFAVGSPLGVFLALRNIRLGIGNGHEYWEEENINEEMPACRRIFNIFHPFDPVAYRLEPLICKEYITKRPVIIPYHKGGKRLHIGLQEFAENLTLRSQAVMDQLHSARVKVLTLCQSRNKDGLDEASEDSDGNTERSYGSIMMERLSGSENGRVDHMLQDKTFQHPYISAIGAHTNYWRDYDTALFILKHLYRDIPEDHGLHEEAQYGSSEQDSGLGDWLTRREDAEAELPLTFSDSNLVRNFSRKARDLMKKQ